MIKNELKHCVSTCRDGQIYQFSGYPDIRIVDNAFYLPKNPHRDNDFFGVFDKYGRLVNECSMFWHRDNRLSMHPREAKICHLWDYHTIDSAIYCGYVGLHYGHVLLDFVSRIWPLKQNLRLPKKILIHSHFTRSEILSRKWFREILDIACIDPEDIILFDIPIKINKLYAPNPGCEADSYVYKGFMDFCNSVGEEALSKVPSIDYPVYLSRRNLNSGSICLQNEIELVSFFEQKGIKEVFPEKLSIYDQIAIFSGKYPILGISGSSFHTSIFSKSPKGVGINFSEELTETFFALDRANNADIEYVYSPYMKQIIPSNKGFPITVSIENPKKFAFDVYELWERKIDKNDIENKNETEIGKIYNIKDHTGKWLKALKHNGEIVSSSSFGEDRISCMLTLISENNSTFINADHQLGFPIFAAGMTSGQKKINVNIDDGNWIASDGKYLRCPSNYEYCPADFNSRNKSTWEKFHFIESLNQKAV